MCDTMKKLLVIPFLFFMSLGLVSCLDDDDPIYYFMDEPAMVKSVGDIPTIKTAHDDFIVPPFTGAEVKEGDFLWTAFTVDLNNQPSKDRPWTARDFSYKKVGSSEVKMPATDAEFDEYMKDSYIDSISVAVLYNTYIDSVLFFGFSHVVSSGKAFEYELILKPEKEKDTEYPTLYIRAKEVKPSVEPLAQNKNSFIYAFDMTEFVKYYKDEISKENPMRFNLKYKVKKEGEDEYRAFESNPIPWNIK